MNIYVGNISYTLEDHELRDAFEQYGDVASATILKDRDTGRSRGFGFVEMNNDDEARAAIEALDGTELGGRSLRVNEARPREDRRSGGGGGGNRGFGGGDRRGGGGGQRRRY